MGNNINNLRYLLESKGWLPLGRAIKNRFKNNRSNSVGSFGAGSINGSGAGGRFRIRNIDYTPKIVADTILIPVTYTRADAFKEARLNGDSTFWFNNKLYTTELAPPNINLNLDSIANLDTAIRELIPAALNEGPQYNEDDLGSNIVNWNGPVVLHFPVKLRIK